MEKRQNEIIIAEIRNSVKMGDTEMIWKRVNQLKNNKSKPVGEIIHNEGNGKMASNDGVIGEMRKYIKLSFHKERGA